MKKSIRRTDHRMSAKNKNYMQTVLVERHSSFFHFIFFSFVLSLADRFFAILCTSIGNISASQASIVLICVLKTIANNRITCFTQKGRHQYRNACVFILSFSFQWLTTMYAYSDAFCHWFGALIYVFALLRKSTTNRKIIVNISSLGKFIEFWTLIECGFICSALNPTILSRREF